MADKATEELLRLLDEYEALANGGFRTDFKEGFLNLSRANFNTNGLRTYGVKDIDLRNCNACKVVKTVPEFELVDLLLKDAKTPKPKEERKDDVAGITSALKDVKINATTEIEEPTVRDPIKQFGGIVPYQLRQSQKSFNLALIHAVKLVNLQRKITKLLDELQ